VTNSLHKEYAYGNISQKMANNTYTDMTPPTMMSYPLNFKLQEGIPQLVGHFTKFLKPSWLHSNVYTSNQK